MFWILLAGLAGIGLLAGKGSSVPLSKRFRGKWLKQLQPGLFQPVTAPPSPGAAPALVVFLTAWKGGASTYANADETLIRFGPPADAPRFAREGFHPIMRGDVRNMQALLGGGSR